MPQGELETALASIYPQDLEKLAVDLLSECGYNVDPTGTSGDDGGLDGLLHDGDRDGALHVARRESNKLRGKVTDDAGKLANHERSYDFFMFVTSADPSGGLCRRIEAEIQEEYGWKTKIWDRERLRNKLMTDHQALAREHLNVDQRDQFNDHRAKIVELRDERLDQIEVRRDLPNELPDGPALAVHLIPNNVFNRGPGTHPGKLPSLPYFGRGKRSRSTPVNDGAVSLNNRFRDEHPDYVFLNEAGWVEAVSTRYFEPVSGPGGFIDPSIDEEIKWTVTGVLGSFEDLGVKPPIFVSIALLEVEQYVFDNNSHIQFESKTFPNRFTTPLIELQEIDRNEFEIEHLRDGLDRIWYQAGRSNGSPYLSNVEESSPY